MPIISKIDIEANTILRSVIGELTKDAVTQAFSESLMHPDFSENMNVIWDMTKADLNALSADHLIGIVDHISTHIKSRGSDYKIAIVAPKDINFGISRMFKSYGGELPISINILRNIDEAFNWIDN